jgi:hypothetical protein
MVLSNVSDGVMDNEIIIILIAIRWQRNNNNNRMLYFSETAGGQTERHNTMPKTTI